uniref:Immunoglobulin V-set domain-containing protein n=1 Tax=Terrapene triunguis TaxID=2587831 RepID=A0A674JSX9_9SAUR
FIKLLHQILTFSGGELHRGPAFTGRETPANDCSLRIIGVTPQDSGDYTLVFQAGGRYAETFGRLQVSGKSNGGAVEARTGQGSQQGAPGCRELSRGRHGAGRLGRGLGRGHQAAGS